MNSFEVMAIGDTTQDVFLRMSDASLQCDLDGENCRLCFDYAEKISVDGKMDVPAVGNAANHAIGVARLGCRAAIYTVVGDDTQGHIAEQVFADNRVATDYIVFDKEHGTNFSAVINYQSERTIFVFHEPRQYQLPDLPATEWVYVTSASGEGVEELHRQLTTYLRAQPKVKLAFNPGTYQIKLGREKLKPLLGRTEILFLNREESMRILGVETREITALTRGFHELGVQIMVLTDGPDGAYLSDRQKIWHLKIFPGPVVERTGCGDAFGSGFLGAVVAGKPLPEAMLWGNANATSVVQYIGAREGLLTRDQLEKMIAENATIVPTEFKGV